MSTDQAGPKILAIGSDDDFLHVYENVQELLSDDTIGTGPEELSGPIEFFDSDGYRLAGEYDRQWHLLNLKRTTEQANPAAVAQRVRNVIDHMRWCLERHPEEAQLYGSVNEVLELFPSLSASTDLATCIQAFTGGAGHGDLMVAALGAGADADERPRNRKHNMAHRFGWKHN